MFNKEKANIDIFLLTKDNTVTGYGIDRVESLIFYKNSNLKKEGHILRHKRITESFLSYLVTLSYDKTRNVVLMRSKK